LRNQDTEESFDLKICNRNEGGVTRLSVISRIKSDDHNNVNLRDNQPVGGTPQKHTPVFSVILYDVIGSQNTWHVTWHVIFIADQPKRKSWLKNDMSFFSKVLGLSKDFVSFDFASSTINIFLRYPIS